MSKSKSVKDDGEIVPVNDTDHVTADALRAFKPTENSRASYQGMFPAATWNHISTALFEAFYANALYDVICPGDIYASEIGRLNKEIERLSRVKGPAPTNVQPGAAPTMTDEEQLERVKRAVTTLSADLPVQKKHVASVLKSIETQKVDYFKSETVSQAAATTFLARCIYPRCMQGPDDALYCFHFITLLHEKGTPGFATLHLLDAMIITLSRALYGLTEGEAANVSILLFEIWKLVSKWRYDEKAFQKEVAGKPGSFMVDSTEGNEEPVSISYEDYEVLYNKWHAAIGAVVLGCLKSSEYMHTRNCLIVLTRMVEVYPTRPKLGRQFIKALEPLQSETYPLADIRASAQAYNMQLLRARADGAWKEEDAADVEARMEKEQAAAARQKKAQEQMAR
jgi:THO complex subunit 2